MLKYHQIISQSRGKYVMLSPNDSKSIKYDSKSIKYDTNAIKYDIKNASKPLGTVIFPILFFSSVCCRHKIKIPRRSPPGVRIPSPGRQGEKSLGFCVARYVCDSRELFPPPSGLGLTALRDEGVKCSLRPSQKILAKSCICAASPLVHL